MRKCAAALLLGLSLLGLPACSSVDANATFPIAQGPLQANELPMDSYAPVAFAARVFDVVNQDMTAENNTGIAGKVTPMPVDILSAYAAKKFRATGGEFATRFVIQQAQFQMRSVTEEDGGWFGGSTTKAEMTLTVNAMLTASKMNGLSANISALTTQSQRLSFNSSEDARRAAYMELMGRALAALDAEITKQLPDYFEPVLAR